MLLHEHKVAFAHMVRDNKDILFGKYSSSVTKAKKAQTWEDIFQTLKALGCNTVRDTSQLRRYEWDNMKRRAQKMWARSLQPNAEEGIVTPLDQIVLEVAFGDNIPGENSDRPPAFTVSDFTGQSRDDSNYSPNDDGVDPLQWCNAKFSSRSPSPTNNGQEQIVKSEYNHRESNAKPLMDPEMNNYHTSPPSTSRSRRESENSVSMDQQEMDDTIDPDLKILQAEILQLQKEKLAREIEREERKRKREEESHALNIKILKLEIVKKRLDIKSARKRIDDQSD